MRTQQAQRPQRPQRYKTIADEFAAAIRAGTLAPGARLPTHRDLARDRGIALATAGKVYAELCAAGLVAGEPGRGMFVRDQSGYAGLDARRLPLGTRVADLSFNQPLAAHQGNQLRQALRDLAAVGSLDALLAQQPPGGRERDRAAVATYLLSRHIDVPPANVLITGGAQHGLDIAFSAIAAPGQVVAVDALTYPGVKLVAAARHIELAAIHCYASGSDLDDLEALCNHRRVEAIYLMPTVHNPLGSVLNADDRDRVVAIARRHDCVIVEDGTHAFLDPYAPKPLQARAPERTVYVASLSKNVATGLRFGFLVAPDHLLPAMTRALRASSWSTPGLVTALATRWLRDGTVTTLETDRRADARRRQAIATRELAGLDYTAHPSAYSGWLRLPAEARSDHVAHVLANEGILVSTADAFAVNPHPPNALRLALGTVDETRLPSTLHRIREAARQAAHEPRKAMS
jgi:DNA-binding transcriptional MocR family regulator